MTLPTISKNSKKEVLSKVEKEFNRQIKKIHKIREQIAFIKSQEQLFQQKYVPILVELDKVRLELHIEILEILDNHFLNSPLSKKEKKILEMDILERVSDLMENSSDERLIEIYNRYAPKTYEEELREKEDWMNSWAELFGVDIEKIKSGEFNPEDFYRQNRKKTPKQLEKEAQLALEAKNLSKSVKTIYTSLVKNLHPDLEQDEAKKAEKTELMTTLTNAYEQKDIFTLLQMHITHLQDSGQMLEGAVEEQINLYNKQLKTQIKELEQEKHRLLYGSISPLMQYAQDENFEKIIKKEIREGKKHNEDLKIYVMWLKDVKNLKTRLKDRQQGLAFNQINLEEMLDMMAEMYFGSDTKKRKPNSKK
jgi:hypothetical protein